MESDKLFGGEIINISAEESYSVNYIAEVIGGEKVYLPAREGDPKNTKADITLAKELLDWQPETSLKEGIEKTKQWLEKNVK